ncbi:MAG: glycosyltransferase family 39 protein [Candidatus Caenarcaniphilales bacterium]|nr:glycosyltransferase family 39 protein [Candidatus Caenarcaniphilales bacterium]
MSKFLQTWLNVIARIIPGDSKKLLLYGLFVLGIIFFLRLVSLSFSPLLDTTETRYAGIAQSMVLLNDWITPRLPQAFEPFLAKPPLSFWLTAAAFKVLGCNEFSARLPNFLEAVLVTLFTYMIARKWYGSGCALLACLVLWSSIFFFIQAGTVNLDMLVCLHLTSSIWAIWQILEAGQEGKPWKRFFYELLLAVITACGLLNKGPFTMALTLGSFVLFVLFSRDLKNLLRVNWFLVIGLAILMAAPWYLEAQGRNPDFFNYFFVQEHFLRYVSKDYGDRYGSAHHQPYGMSWVFLLAAFMPWSLILIVSLREAWSNWRRHKFLSLSSQTAFLLAWILFTPLFFTSARSILMNYILASLPALSILVAPKIHSLIVEVQTEPAIENLLKLVALTVLLIAGVLFAFSGAYPYQLNPIAPIIISIVIVLLSFLIGALAVQSDSRAIYALLLVSWIGMPATLVTWYGPIANSIEDNKSLKHLVNQIALYDPGWQKVIFYREAPPSSWHFYTQAPLLNGSKLGLSQPFPQVVKDLDLESSQGKILIIRDALLSNLKLSYPGVFVQEPIAAEGKYYAFKLP